MTQAEYDEADVLQFAGGDDDRDTTNDRVPFRLGEHPDVLIGSRPKMAVLLDVMAALNDDSDEAAQALAFSELLEEVLEPDSVEAIRGRLRDRNDTLDLDSPGIQQMFKTLVGLWYEGPTGKGRGSRPSPARTGRRSTARARSRA